MSAPPRPLIGVSCYHEQVDRSPWVCQRSAVLPWGYVEHLQRAGAHAVVLPPREDADVAMAHEVLARLDGLVVAGGADVEPSRYAAQPHPLVQQARRDRDAWELALVEASAQRGLPLLGVCRGMQVMAVAAGASLVQHLPDVVGHEEHSPQPGVYTSHPVRCLPGTRLADLLGADELVVPTYHHQGVDERTLAHTAYVVAARHADGTVEAIEPREGGGPLRLGVQWHPEAGEDTRLFDALVAAAASGQG